MKYRRVFLFVAFIIFVAEGTAYSIIQSSEKVRSKEVKLVKVYKHNQLQDITADGKILFHEIKAPIWQGVSYLGKKNIGFYSSDSKASLTFSGTLNFPAIKSQNALRVVENESGREIAKKILGEFHDVVVTQFIPSTNKVFYRNDKQDNFQLWDFKSDVTRVCLKEAALRYISFLNEREAFGIVDYEKNGILSQLLVKLELPRCELREIGGIYEPNLGGESFLQQIDSAGITFTTDKKRLFYVVNGKLIIRNTSTFKIERVVKVAPRKLSFFNKPVFTPDGKYLLLQAEGGYEAPDRQVWGTEPRPYLLLIYDAKTLRKLDQVKVFDGQNLAVSPDSRFLAIAYRSVGQDIFKINEQAHINLFELSTGRKLTTISHKSLATEKTDGAWRSKVKKMLFTSDGRYLLTSTLDTYVWDVSNLTSAR